MMIEAMYEEVGCVPQVHILDTVLKVVSEFVIT